MRFIALVLAMLGLSSACNSALQEEFNPDELACPPEECAVEEVDDPFPAALKAKNWVYLIGGYKNEKLDELTRAKVQLVVIDPARDTKNDLFDASEVAKLKASGKKVLAYITIGAVEKYRTHYKTVKSEAPDLLLHAWPDFPDELFVKYWEERWWDLGIQPRLKQLLDRGYDGVYMDTPLAYEELDLSKTPGETRESLAQKMVALIVRISRYAKGQNPDFLVFPQNSPELREVSGYTEAIDGIGMESLFYRPNHICDYSFCKENLTHARALKKAGKLVLVVDYPNKSSWVSDDCRRMRKEGFTPYVTRRSLNKITPRCP
jgi:cysteinyl-tRNA synthetase